MKLLLYCTKSKWQLFRDIITGKWLIDKIKNRNAVNGKIVAECDFEVETIYFDNITEEYYMSSFPYIRGIEEMYQKMCLDYVELSEYLDNEDVSDDCGYAIHIKNLNIFDVPTDLSEYSKKVEHCKCDKCLDHCKHYYAKNNITKTTNTGCTKYTILYKAPQNMMYVFDLEEKKVLISIHPEWLCKILNGEKTIEVRKKVLKEMIK